MTQAGPAPEFSRPIAVDQLKDRENPFAIEASAAERKALAERFGILGIDSLKAEIRLKPIAGDQVRLTGHVRAEVHQACVVTLVDVPAAVEADFERVYSPHVETAADEDGDEDEEIELDFSAEEPPDPLVDGMIDIGEAAAEEVALALDPYPRAPGAVFDRPEEGEPERANPFAALAKLKKEK